MYLFSFFSILGWISFFYYWRKKNLAYYPLLVVTALISLLYIFAYLKILNFGSVILFVLGLFLLVKTLVANYKTIFFPRKALKILKKTPVGIVFFILAGIAWYIFTLKATIFGWDEFFWGQFTKAILDSNDFYTINSAIIAVKANYPPGISLFQYYFLHFGRYSEPALYFAQGIIIFSVIALILDLVKKNIKSLLVIFLAIASATVYFGPGLLSITNDHILGIIFGGTILALLFVLRSNKERLWLVPAVFSLPLIKSTGIILSLTVVLLATLDSIISSIRLPRKKTGLKVDVFVFALTIILGLSAFLPMQSWSLHMKRQGFEATASIPSWSKIKNAFSENASKREKLVIDSFKKALVSLPMNQQEGSFGSDHPAFKLYLKAVIAINRPALSIPAWLIIITVLLGTIFYFQKKKERTVSLTLYLSLIAGLSVFLAVHFLAYIFYFSEYEALNLASMNRYISAYLLGMVIVVIGSIAFFINKNPDKSKALKTVSLATLLYLFVFHTPSLVKLVIPPKTMAASTNVVRDKTREFSSYINANTESSSRIWVIYQNTKGWECMMIRYDITPRSMNRDSWSLGNIYGPNDHWTNNLSAEAFAEQLSEKRYDYVFLAKTDDNFWSHYEKLFENPLQAKSHKLFKVIKRNNEVLLSVK